MQVPAVVLAVHTPVPAVDTLEPPASTPKLALPCLIVRSPGHGRRLLATRYAISARSMAFIFWTVAAWRAVATTEIPLLMAMPVTSAMMVSTIESSSSVKPLRRATPSPFFQGEGRGGGLFARWPKDGPPPHPPPPKKGGGDPGM